MPLNYDRTDLNWTNRGDFVIGHNGDIMDTYADPLRSLYQEIRTRLMSDVGDWAMYGNVGASISDFVGEPNNKVTAESLKRRVITSLTRDGLVANKDIDVKYMPIDIDKIMLRLSIKVLATSRNASSQALTIGLVYTYSENNVFFIG
jgi:hypothetical protein